MNSRFLPTIGSGAAIVLLIVGFVLSWRFFGRMDPYSTLVASDSQLPITLSNVELHTRDNGITTGVIDASSLTVSPERNTISVSQLTNGVFYRRGTPALTFSAARLGFSAARFNSSSKITVDGGIHFSTIKSVSLPYEVTVDTPSLNWDSATSLAVCPDAVKFKIDYMGAGSAQGFALNTDNNNIHVASVIASQHITLVDSLGSPNPQSQIAQTPEATTTVPESNILTYSADDCYWDAQERLLTIKGAVTFHQGKSTVDMVGATYDRQTDIAKSASPIKITDPDTTVTGDSGTINFSTHLAVLQGHIKMQIVPKPEDKVTEPEAKKPTTILCDQINYNYRQKKAHTTGQVVIQQPSTGRTVTSDIGEYDANLKTVDLVGHVIGKSKDGKLIKAPHATLSVDPGNEWLQLDGPITGTMPVSDADNPAPPESTVKRTSTSLVSPPGNNALGTAPTASK